MVLNRPMDRSFASFFMGIRRWSLAAAAYAMVLHAFLLSASGASAFGFDPSATPLCSEMASGTSEKAPSNPQHPTHLDCLCLASCMAAGLVALPPVPSAAPYVPAALSEQPDQLRAATPALTRLDWPGLGARAPPARMI